MGVEGATTEEGRMEGTTRAEAAGLLPTFLLRLLVRQRRRESRKREAEREREKERKLFLLNLLFARREEGEKNRVFFLSFIALPSFPSSPPRPSPPCALYPFSQLTPFSSFTGCVFTWFIPFFLFSLFARKTKKK